MGIIQENRNGVTGHKKVTTDYGVENVDVTGKNGNDKKELSKEEAAKNAEAEAKLFTLLMTKAIEANKIAPSDERIAKFGDLMDEYSKGDVVSTSEGVINVLKQVGLDEIADAYKKACSGIDVDMVVAELPGLPEETPADDDVVDAGDETENGDNADASDGDNGNVDTVDNAPADAPEVKADEAPAEETTERRRPGRPSNKK